jgi:hypothetical protein
MKTPLDDQSRGVEFQLDLATRNPPNGYKHILAPSSKQIKLAFRQCYENISAEAASRT